LPFFFLIVFFSSGEGRRQREGEDAGQATAVWETGGERPVESRVYVGRPGAVASDGGVDFG
jgi:hypothetical protein